MKAALLYGYKDLRIEEVEKPVAGEDEIVKKVGEEAVEVILAVKGQGDERVVAEVADLFYHSLVLLAARGLTLAEELEDEGDVKGGGTAPPVWRSRFLASSAAWPRRVNISRFPIPNP